MSLRLYNTLSKREEDFVPLHKGKVTMYTCGPTVYGRPHIGNYASFLMADLLRRWLEAGHGYTVTHVKNITDVGHLLHDADHGDDKIQKEAERQSVHPLHIARRYEKEFLDDEKILEMLEPHHRPRASQYIKEQLTMIKKLLKKKVTDKYVAYETEDGIYFDVSTFPQYGALSGNTLENLSVGKRIEVNEKKHHPADFALWKKCTGDNARHLLRWKFSTGEVSSSSGEDLTCGFPGWHVECSAMSSALLGAQIDIHTGGEDNIFPHHECEIAQSESASGTRPFVRYWVHRRRINLGSAKMSKSLGNLLTLDDISHMGYSAMDLRYYLLSVHYRTNLKFTKRGLDDASKARRKIMEWINTIGLDGVSIDRSHGTRLFTQAMDADLNTPAALAVVFDCINAWYREGGGERAELREFVRLIQRTFGCFTDAEEIIPAHVQALLDRRETARCQGDFETADALRIEILALGYEIRDSGSGPMIQKTVKSKI